MGTRIESRGMRRASAFTLLAPAFCLVLLFLAVGAPAKVWGPREIVEWSGYTEEVGATSASWDAYGNIHVAWTNWYGGWIQDMFYKRFDYQSQSWLPTDRLTNYQPVTHSFGAVNPYLDSDLGVSGYSHTFLSYAAEDYIDETQEWLVLNRDGVSQEFSLNKGSYSTCGPLAVEESTGNAHVVYIDQPASEEPYQLYYRKYTLGGGWGAPVALTNDTEIKSRLDIAVDRFGNVHVVWDSAIDIGMPQTLYYLKYTVGVGWGTRQLLATSAGIFNPQIEADRHDPPYLHVVWVDWESGQPYDIFYKSWRGSWSSETNLSNETEQSTSPSLATDPSGAVHVLWQNTTSGDIKYRKWTGSWESTQVLTSPSWPAWCGYVTTDWYNNVYVFFANSYRLEMMRWADPNTLVGSDVAVDVGDHTVTFTSVSGEGITTVSESSNGTPIPGEYASSCSPMQYFHIETTATYSGNVEVCLHYDDGICDEGDLHLLHYDAGTWTDVTSSVDTGANMVCGIASHLSQFVLATPTGQTPPVVSTGTATGMTFTTAVLHGNLTSLGTASSVDVSFEWGTTTAYGHETSVQTLTGPGPFSAVVTGLPLGVEHHFRAKAVGHGTAYGGDSSFRSSGTFVVEADGSGDYPTIQAAISAGQDHDVIELGDGTYTGSGNRDVDFLGKGITVMSQSEDASLCIIDCQASAGDQHRGFIFQSQEGSDSQLRGVTVRGAYAYHAAGLFCESGSSPSIYDCIFENNYAESRGGGLSAHNGSAPTISDCTFRHNSAGTEGGALRCYDGTPELYGCVFHDNTAVTNGGAVHLNIGSSVYFDSCIFHDNQSGGNGGAIYAINQSAPILEWCTIYDNIADGDGGGMYFWQQANAHLSGCTLAGNQGGDASGLSVHYGSSPIVENTIIAFGHGGTVAYCDVSTGCTATLECSDVYGNEGGDWVGYIASQYGVNGNIGADPLFCDAAGGDFGLQLGSPCSDAVSGCGTIGAYGVSCGPGLIVVQPDGSGDYPTIQAAIDAVHPSGVVELADGVFTGSGNRDLSFGGKAITVRSQSGDPELCIIDCQGTPSVEHRGFVFNSGEGSSSLLENLTIRNAYAYHAAGLFCESGASPTIRGCVFRDNTATSSAGALGAHNGSAPTVSDCLFSENHAGGEGGALRFYDSSPTVEDCTLVGNTSDTNAGAIAAKLNCHPVISGCTLHGNGGGTAAGLGLTYSSSFTVSNTIIAFGTAGPAASCDGGSSLTLECCDVYGNAGGDYTGCIAGQNGANGNIGGDPLFCNAATGDLTLQGGSPCAAPNNPGCGQIGAQGAGCGAVIRVEADGSGDHPTIQAAVDVATSGDIIELGPGTFTGTGNRDVDPGGKELTIRSSEGRQASVIDCGGSPGEPHRAFHFHSGEGPAFLLENVIITNGHAGSAGAILCESASSPTIRGCRFVGNASEYNGGALACSNSSAPMIDHCTFLDNMAGQFGGGLWVDFYAENMLVTCSTFSGNHAEQDGGGAYVSVSSVTLDRVILWGNVCPDPLMGPQLGLQNHPTVTVTCSDVQGGEGAVHVEEGSTLVWEAGNIAAFPIFCGPAAGDHTLNADSPCLPANNTCGVQMGAHGEGCSGATEVAEPEVPAVFFLAQNVPNPFNPRTEIRFGLPEPAVVDLVIFDLAGRRVRTLLAGSAQPAGLHRLSWDGRDDGGRAQSAGIYFCRLEAGPLREIRKMTLLR
jgi:predicted outer membrane repeat protein